MQLRRLIAIAMCGLVAGSVMSIFGSAPATARTYIRCDNRIENLDRKSMRQLAKGHITQAQFDAIQAEIAAHRAYWSC